MPSTTARAPTGTAASATANACSSGPSAAGWHQWTQPTQQQTKQRLTIRRNARTAPR